MTTSADDSELVCELQALLLDHPLFQEAKAKTYCSEAVVLLFSDEDIRGFQLEQKPRNVLLDVVKKPTRRLRGLFLLTADEVPEALGGFGDSYTFFFHPDKNLLLHAEVGTWRS